MADLDAKKTFVTRTILAIAICPENMVMIILPPVVAALASVRRIEEQLDELDSKKERSLISSKEGAITNVSMPLANIVNMTFHFGHRNTHIVREIDLSAPALWSVCGIDISIRQLRTIV